MRGPLILLLSLFLSAASTTYAHEYYFCYAEVEYNDLSRKFEVTIIGTAHDIEKGLNFTDKIALEEINDSSDEYSTIESYLNKHFIINGTTPDASFKLVGIEVDLNGEARFYLESNEVDISESLIIRFDLLMDQFEEQQNKLTFIHRDHTATIVFMQHQQTQEIELSKL